MYERMGFVRCVKLGRPRLIVLGAILALTVVAGVLRYTDTALVALFFVASPRSLGSRGRSRSRRRR